MRNFLLNICICSCVNVWQEGHALSHCFDNLLKYADYIAVMMDHPDEETETTVSAYRDTYPHIFRLGYVTAPALKNPNNVRRREKVYRSSLVEDKLALVKKIHQEERPVNILLNPDSDEIYNISLPQILTDFWNSDKTSIFMKSIDVYGNYYLIHNKGLMSHCRAYRYCEEINFTPRRYQDFYNPYSKRQAVDVVNGGYIHLSQHADFRKIKSMIGDKKIIDSHPNAKFWELNKPAYELTVEEYKDVIKREPKYIAKSNYQFLSSVL